MDFSNQGSERPDIKHTVFWEELFEVMFLDDEEVKKNKKNHLVCPICLRGSTTAAFFKTHINGVHNGIKLFKCDICSRLSI
jgi:hypothetical protein